MYTRHCLYKGGSYVILDLHHSFYHSFYQYLKDVQEEKAKYSPVLRLPWMLFHQFFTILNYLFLLLIG